MCCSSQMVLGIVTVISAPWQLAILHQFGAVVLWVLILRARFLARYPLAQSCGGHGMSAYDALLAPTSARPRRWRQVAGPARLGPGNHDAARRRDPAGRGMAAIEGVLHARRTDPRIGDWLAAATRPGSTPSRAQLRQIRRDYDRAHQGPGRAGRRDRRAPPASPGHLGRGAARRRFRPLRRHAGRGRAPEARGGRGAGADGGDPYDALLEDYEPGATGAGLEAMFGALRPRLVALRDADPRAERQPAMLSGEFAEAAQLRSPARWPRLRLRPDPRPDRQGGASVLVGLGADVRITTRTAPHDPFNCIYSTIHEVGHAAYEQGIAAAYALTPLGQGVSMGVHESQSRIYENQLGRSRAFHLALRADAALFGDLGSRRRRPSTRREPGAPGYIRTEADEVHYNLHILLRFDLERALISGDAGGARSARGLERPVRGRFRLSGRPALNGVLQDVHWSVGLFGYFPTYTLGNVYAGCLHKALRADLCPPRATGALADLHRRAELGGHGPGQRHGLLLQPVGRHHPVHQPELARAARHR
jgi:carboxypeptidase Taq